MKTMDLLSSVPAVRVDKILSSTGRGIAGTMGGLAGGMVMAVTLAPDASYLPLAGAAIGGIDGLCGGMAGWAIVGVFYGLFLSALLTIPACRVAVRLYDSLDLASLGNLLVRVQWDGPIAVALVLGVLAGGSFGLSCELARKPKIKPRTQKDERTLEYLRKLEGQPSEPWVSKPRSVWEQPDPVSPTYLGAD